MTLWLYSVIPVRLPCVFYICITAIPVMELFWLIAKDKHSQVYRKK